MGQCSSRKILEDVETNNGKHRDDVTERAISQDFSTAAPVPVEANSKKNEEDEIIASSSDLPMVLERETSKRCYRLNLESSSIFVNTFLDSLEYGESNENDKSDSADPVVLREIPLLDRRSSSMMEDEKKGNDPIETSLTQSTAAASIDCESSSSSISNSHDDTDDDNSTADDDVETDRDVVAQTKSSEIFRGITNNTSKQAMEIEKARDLVDENFPSEGETNENMNSNIVSLFVFGEYDEFNQLVYDGSKRLESTKELHDDLFDLEEATRLNNKAVQLAEEGDFMNAVTNFKKANEIFQKQNHESVPATLYSIGSAYDRLCKPNEAMEYYNDALSRYQECPEKHCGDDIADVLYSIGHLHYACNEYDMALERHYECLAIREESTLDEEKNDILITKSLKDVEAIILKKTTDALMYKNSYGCSPIRTDTACCDRPTLLT